MAAVWETQAAGSMGRMGSPAGRRSQGMPALPTARPTRVGVRVQGNTEGRRHGLTYARQQL